MTTYDDVLGKIVWFYNEAENKNVFKEINSSVKTLSKDEFLKIVSTSGGGIKTFSFQHYQYKNIFDLLKDLKILVSRYKNSPSFCNLDARIFFGDENSLYIFDGKLV